jgi:hypothetical protein
MIYLIVGDAETQLKKLEQIGFGALILWTMLWNN